jgi:hypothetical protein
MAKEKKVLGQKALTAEEKKRKEEKEKREKEKERKERKAREASDRTFGLKNKNVSAKVAARVEELKRDAPTKEAARARAEAKAREKKKQKEAEEEAKREMEILMGVRSSVVRKKKPDGADGEELAEELEAMGVTAEPKNFVRKKVEYEDEEEEHKRELTEEERREILTKIELEKAHAKEAELKAAANVNPFHVEDEGWFEEGEDPYELLKMVAGNKRAIIMPKDHVQPMES